MTFLCYAGPAFFSRAEVLLSSIKKYHPDDQIVYKKLDNNVPVGQYDYRHFKYIVYFLPVASLLLLWLI